MTTHPYTIKMWYPHTATQDTASLVLTMKAPELGNSETRARNQVIQRSRAGTTYVYDRGQSLNAMLSLAFQNVPDSERSAFIVFMDTIQWSSTKFKYLDHLGVERIVRFANNSMKYTDFGPQKREHTLAANQVPLWSFAFDLIDLTNSLADIEETDSPVATQIALHIANFNDPHNPVTTIAVKNTDGTLPVESVPVDDFDAVIWSVVAKLNGRKEILFIMATHDGFGVTDATGAEKSSMLGGAIGTALGMTFTVDVSGAAAAQVLNLKVATSETSYVTIKAKRAKF